MTFTGKIALCVLLCSTASAAARAPQATLTVRVVDPTGTPITDALVVIHPEPPGNKPGHRDGLTRLALDAATTAFRRDLPAGDYDVFVAVAGFYPSCRRCVCGAEKRTLSK
ncbi:MAG: carboxypeptidase-like regulatory domain-containing protein [Candidatus Acidiferrales bacterium]